MQIVGPLQDLIIGVGSSAITGGTIWAVRRSHMSRMRRRREIFLGAARSRKSRVVIVVGHDPAAPRSIERSDVDALLEVATLVQPIGLPIDVFSDVAISSIDKNAIEFCISGIDANERTAAHLRRHLPGVAIPHHSERDDGVFGDIRVGGRRYRREPGALIMCCWRALFVRAGPISSSSLATRQ